MKTPELSLRTNKDFDHLGVRKETKEAISKHHSLEASKNSLADRSKSPHFEVFRNLRGAIRFLLWCGRHCRRRRMIILEACSLISGRCVFVCGRRVVGVYRERKVNC